MKEQYSKICRNLIEYYEQYLSNKEIEALRKILTLDNYDNFNIIIFINKLIDRVWQLTLTNPLFYKQGEPFKFLITRDLIPNYFNISDIKDFKKNINHSLELIDETKVLETVNGISGIIVNIDYINTFSYPLLPIDFKDNDTIWAKTKLDPIGVYNISLNLKNYDISEESSNDFAQETHLPKIDIIKSLYNFKKNNKILDKTDYDSLANQIIVYFLVENNYKKDIVKVRDILKQKYKKEIIKQYTKYFNGHITLEDFVTIIFNLLETDVLLEKFDKSM